MRTVTAVVDMGLSFLILSTNVDNVVLFIKSAKVRRYYVCKENGILTIHIFFSQPHGHFQGRPRRAH